MVISKEYECRECSREKAELVKEANACTDPAEEKELRTLARRIQNRFYAYNSRCFEALLEERTTAFIPLSVYPYSFTKSTGLMNVDYYDIIRQGASAQSARDLSEVR